MMKGKLLRAAAVMIVGVTALGLYSFANRERLFLDRAFVQLGGGRGTEYVEVIKLGSGESAAMILEHDCCTGAGFDAVAIRTSDGQEFYATKNYCGIEGFYGALEDDAAKDLPHFKAFLAAHGFQKK